MARHASLFRESTDQLVALLVQTMAIDHLGRRAGVTATVLANKLRVTERTLRLLISRAREEGTAIVGTPETGYFIASTAAELEECCRFLRSRAMHSLMIEARLRKIPLPDLLGQLHLRT